MDTRRKSIPGRGHRGSRVVSAEGEEEMHGRHEIGKVVGTGLIGLEDHSEDVVFILSEMGAAEHLNFGQVEVGALVRLLPFP